MKAHVLLVTLLCGLTAQLQAQDASALEAQYKTCAKHYIPADKCTPEIYQQLKAKENAPVAQEKLYAPLPEKVIAAKTVVFINYSGTAKFGDDLYRQIKAWNRWQVVTDKTKADLILVLSPSETVPVVISSASAIARLFLTRSATWAALHPPKSKRLR